MIVFYMRGKLFNTLIALITLFTLLFVFAGCQEEAPAPAPAPAPTPIPAPSTDITPKPAQLRVRVATTTSLYDTGLWGYLEPMFEEKYGVELDVLYTGSGQALEYGRRGDVDALTVHDKPNELKFVSDNYSKERVPFAYNYFLIVGPAADPAGIKGMAPDAALKKLKETASASFISRGDNSGTHNMEKRLWEKAGYKYGEVQNAGAWYVQAGSGMGPVLQMASEKAGYTLTDMGTYVAFKSQLNLMPIVDKGSDLLNVYSVLAINPEKVTVAKNLKMAQNMITFLSSPEVQDLIGKYGVKEYGIQLFVPCAGKEPTS